MFLTIIFACKHIPTFYVVNNRNLIEQRWASICLSCPKLFSMIAIALNMATLKQVQSDVKLLDKRTNMDSELWRSSEV